MTTDPKAEAQAFKPALSDIPASSLLYLGAAMTNGADKYGHYNWRKTNTRIDTYLNAAFRHLLLAMDGHWNDDDSGLPHLAHVMACCAIILDAKTLGVMQMNDDEPGSADAVIDSLTRRNEARRKLLHFAKSPAPSQGAGEPNHHDYVPA